MAGTMRAVDIRNGTGNASALFINPEIPKPKPNDTEVLVQVKAFGLNRMDLLQREGKYPVPPTASKILGVEFSGVVVELGPSAQKTFHVGDEVFGLAYGGAYAEYIAVSSRMLIHKPKSMTWEEAAGIPETWITATQALHVVGEFSPGKSVLWHAGASGVSIAGIQLSKAAGASAVYVTSRTPEKIDWCVNELGAKAGFNTSDGDAWVQNLKENTDNAGVDLVIDYMGASAFQQNLQAAAVDGHIVNLAFLGGTKLDAGVDISIFLLKRLRYEGTSLRSRDLDYQSRLRDKLEQYLPKFEDKTFKLFVDKVFRWEDIQAAHKEMESNQTKGKIICVI